LAERARLVRASLTKQFQVHIHRPLPASATQRRWYMQRLRYFVNRLIYLLPTPDLASLRATLRTFPEFAETVALLTLLLEKDTRELLEMPGAAVSAAASLLSMPSFAGHRVILPDNLSEAAVHSAGTLLLYDVAEVSSFCLSRRSTDERDFLSFCLGQASGTRDRTDFSYLDEVLTLQLGRSPESRVSMLHTRFSHDELSDLEALEIGQEFHLS
jgi:hypothetical protein